MRQETVVEQVARSATEKLLAGETPFPSKHDEVAFAAQVLQQLGIVVSTLEGLDRRLQTLEERVEKLQRARRVEEDVVHMAKRVSERVTPQQRERAAAKVAADFARASQAVRAEDMTKVLRTAQRMKDVPTVEVEWPFPDDIVAGNDYALYIKRGINSVPEPLAHVVKSVVARRLEFELRRREMTVVNGGARPTDEFVNTLRAVKLR